ncbi:MAG: hypothetical protein KatS3mg057_1659 [Herpetosiphonaceae bacterium]|nr:MAG: hypothetical protein KatS3mg057_1659 [Herpetosiphonaceae bacterium]
MNQRRVVRGLLCGLLVLSLLLIPGDRNAEAQTEERICFPEAAPVIRDCIEGRFAQFWRENGGLPVFGYPITSAHYEVNPDTGANLLVQYFERQRFELHPENAWPYDVLLGRLGAVFLDKTKTGPGEKADPSEPNYVPETGYRIGFEPWELHIEGQWYVDYYRSHGLEFDGQPGKSWPESVALFGYPITAVRGRVTDDSSLQIFERTVLRYQPHAKDDPNWRIVPDRIGVWYYKYVLRKDSESRLAWP